MILLSGQLSTQFFVPLIIFLAIACIIPILLSIFKLRFLPTFAVEIIVGICIANWFNSYIDSINLTSLIDGIYVVGLSFIMFLSGYDVDLDVLKESKDNNNKHINILNVCLILLASIYLISFGLSWLFVEDYTIDVIPKVLLITLAISGIFAGLVVPLVHKEKAGNSLIGKVVTTLANLSELSSIVFLSIYMIVIDATEGYWWFSIVMILIIILAYFLMKNKKVNFSNDVSVGIVHLPLRILLLTVLLVVFISDLSGGEYILGAFLIGMLFKTLNLNKSIHTIENLVYGLFAPMFYIIVGTKINIIEFIENPVLLWMVLKICISIIIARLPILILFKWFSANEVIPSIIISTSTIVVSIAVSHIGHATHFLSEEFCEALVLASIITCIIPPILFEAFLDFGDVRKKFIGEETKI